MARKPKTSNNSSEAQIDTGGGQKDAVNAQLALGLAAAGGLSLAGIGAYKSGVPARVLNKATNKTVGLHGSPVQGLKSVDPRISRSDIDIPTVSIMRTNVPPNMRANNVNVTQGYAGNQGSIYVVKANKATTDLPKFVNPPKVPKINAEGRPIIQFLPSVATKSTTSVKVFAEIPVSKFPIESELRREIAKQTRLAGSSMRTTSAVDVLVNLNKKINPKKNVKRGIF